MTDVGNLDLLGDVTGGGGYAALLPFSNQLSIFGVSCHVVTLERLIQLKHAAGRPKDFEMISQLEALLEELGNDQTADDTDDADKA